MSWVREDYMGWGPGGLLVVDLCWGEGGMTPHPAWDLVHIKRQCCPSSDVRGSISVI